MYTDTIDFTAQDGTSIFTDTMVEMNWREIKEYADRESIVLLPVGIIESHGPHLDLSPDIALSHLYCRFLRQALGNANIASLIAPPMYWGHAMDTARYPGTFSISPETMKLLLCDIYKSLDSWNFKNVFLINCHGDQTHVKIMKESIVEANRSMAINVVDLGSLDVAIDNPPTFPLPRKGRFEPDYHAGAIETAQMRTFFPAKVDTATAKKLAPSDSFDPLAYCGDPASYDLETSLIDYYKADLETDVKKIKVFLSKQRQGGVNV